MRTYGADCMPMAGGEACLQSAAASAIGIGSDIGGSIRMPAVFNGVFGHKATTGLYVCMCLSLCNCFPVSMRVNLSYCLPVYAIHWATSLFDLDVR